MLHGHPCIDQTTGLALLEHAHEHIPDVIEFSGPDGVVTLCTTCAVHTLFSQSRSPLTSEADCAPWVRRLQDMETVLGADFPIPEPSVMLVFHACHHLLASIPLQPETAFATLTEAATRLSVLALDWIAQRVKDTSTPVNPRFLPLDALFHVALERFQHCTEHIPSASFLASLVLQLQRLAETAPECGQTLPFATEFLEQLGTTYDTLTALVAGAQFILHTPQASLGAALLHTLSHPLFTRTCLRIVQQPLCGRNAQHFFATWKEAVWQVLHITDPHHPEALDAGHRHVFVDLVFALQQVTPQPATWWLDPAAQPGSERTCLSVTVQALLLAQSVKSNLIELLFDLVREGLMDHQVAAESLLELLRRSVASMSGCVLQCLRGLQLFESRGPAHHTAVLATLVDALPVILEHGQEADDLPAILQSWLERLACSLSRTVATPSTATATWDLLTSTTLLQQLDLLFVAPLPRQFVRSTVASAATQLLERTPLTDTTSALDMLQWLARNNGECFAYASRLLDRSAHDEHIDTPAVLEQVHDLCLPRALDLSLDALDAKLALIRSWLNSGHHEVIHTWLSGPARDAKLLTHLCRLTGTLTTQGDSAEDVIQTIARVVALSTKQPDRASWWAETLALLPSWCLSIVRLTQFAASLASGSTHSSSLAVNTVASITQALSDVGCAYLIVTLLRLLAREDTATDDLTTLHTAVECVSKLTATLCGRFDSVPEASLALASATLTEAQHFFLDMSQRHSLSSTPAASKALVQHLYNHPQDGIKAWFWMQRGAEAAFVQRHRMLQVLQAVAADLASGEDSAGEESSAVLSEAISETSQSLQSLEALLHACSEIPVRSAAQSYAMLTLLDASTTLFRDASTDQEQLASVLLHTAQLVSIELISTNPAIHGKAISLLEKIEPHAMACRLSTRIASLLANGILQLLLSTEHNPLLERGFQMVARLMSSCPQLARDCSAPVHQAITTVLQRTDTLQPHAAATTAAVMSMLSAWLEAALPHGARIHSGAALIPWAHVQTCLRHDSALTAKATALSFLQQLAELDLVTFSTSHEVPGARTVLMVLPESAVVQIHQSWTTAVLVSSSKVQQDTRSRPVVDGLRTMHMLWNSQSLEGQMAVHQSQWSFFALRGVLDVGLSHVPELTIAAVLLHWCQQSIFHRSACALGKQCCWIASSVTSGLVPRILTVALELCSRARLAVHSPTERELARALAYCSFMVAKTVGSGPERLVKANAGGLAQLQAATRQLSDELRALQLSVSGSLLHVPTHFGLFRTAEVPAKRVELPSALHFLFKAATVEQLRDFALHVCQRLSLPFGRAAQLIGISAAEFRQLRQTATLSYDAQLKLATWLDAVESEMVARVRTWQHGSFQSSTQLASRLGLASAEEYDAWLKLAPSMSLEKRALVASVVPADLLQGEAIPESRSRVPKAKQPQKKKRRKHKPRAASPSAPRQPKQAKPDTPPTRALRSQARLSACLCGVTLTAKNGAGCTQCVSCHNTFHLRCLGLTRRMLRASCGGDDFRCFSCV